MPTTATARLARLYERLTGALAALAGLLLVAASLGIGIDVALRACCDSALFGLGDAIEHGIAAATFLAAPWVLARGAHVSVDIVAATLPAHLRPPLAGLADLLGLAISMGFAWACFAAFALAWERESMVRGILAFPEWGTAAPPLIGAVLLALGFALRLAGARPRAAPVGP